MKPHTLLMDSIYFIQFYRQWKIAFRKPYFSSDYYEQATRTFFVETRNVLYVSTYGHMRLYLAS